MSVSFVHRKFDNLSSFPNILNMVYECSDLRRDTIFLTSPVTNPKKFRNFFLKQHWRWWRDGSRSGRNERCQLAAKKPELNSLQQSVVTNKTKMKPKPLLVSNLSDMPLKLVSAQINNFQWLFKKINNKTLKRNFLMQNLDIFLIRTSPKERL